MHFAHSREVIQVALLQSRHDVTHAHSIGVVPERCVIYVVQQGLNAIGGGKVSRNRIQLNQSTVDVLEYPHAPLEALPGTLILANTIVIVWLWIADDLRPAARPERYTLNERLR